MKHKIYFSKKQMSYNVHCSFEHMWTLLYKKATSLGLCNPVSEARTFNKICEKYEEYLMNKYEGNLVKKYEKYLIRQSL